MPLEFSPLQSVLVQHVFLKVHADLKALEAKRATDSRKTDHPPISWENINMHKLSIDAVRIVNLELDALIKNHVNVLPYLNSRTQQYDIDLRPGYEGVKHYRTKFAIDPPSDIVIKLIHKTDHFVPVYKDRNNAIDCYEFQETSPFDRGEVIGGFGYLSYPDPTKNKLFVITQRDFNRARESAKGNPFWANHEWEMKFKTVVHRVMEHLPLDPVKVNSIMRADLESIEMSLDSEIAEFGNGEILTIEASVSDETPSLPQPAVITDAPAQPAKEAAQVTPDEEDDF